MTSTDDGVRTAIKAKIELVAPLAVVLPQWTLGSLEDVANWPGILKSQNDAGRTHGYVIEREETDGRIKGGGQSPMERIWTYLIFGLHYYLTANDFSNSRKLFNAEIDAICAEFDTLASGMDIGGAKRVEPLRFRLDLKPYGGKLHHVGLGRLVLRPC